MKFLYAALFLSLSCPAFAAEKEITDLNAPLTTFLKKTNTTDPRRCALKLSLKSELEFMPGESQLMVTQDGVEKLTRDRMDPPGAMCRVSFRRNSIERTPEARAAIKKYGEKALFSLTEFFEDRPGFLAKKISKSYRTFAYFKGDVDDNQDLIISCRKDGDSAFTLGDLKSQLGKLVDISMICPLRESTGFVTTKDSELDEKSAE